MFDNATDYLDWINAFEDAIESFFHKLKSFGSSMGGSIKIT